MLKLRALLGALPAFLLGLVVRFAAGLLLLPLQLGSLLAGLLLHLLLDLAQFSQALFRRGQLVG